MTDFDDLAFQDWNLHKMSVFELNGIQSNDVRGNLELVRNSIGQITSDVKFKQMQQQFDKVE